MSYNKFGLPTVANVFGLMFWVINFYVSLKIVPNVCNRSNTVYLKRSCSTKRISFHWL